MLNSSLSSATDKDVADVRLVTFGVLRFSFDTDIVDIDDKPIGCPVTDSLNIGWSKKDISPLADSVGDGVILVINTVFSSLVVVVESLIA